MKYNDNMVLRMWGFYVSGKLFKYRVSLIRDFMKSRINGYYPNKTA